MRLSLIARRLKEISLSEMAVEDEVEDRGPEKQRRGEDHATPLADASSKNGSCIKPCSVDATNASKMLGLRFLC
jgi:hypothetical protein